MSLRTTLTATLAATALFSLTTAASLASHSASPSVSLRTVSSLHSAAGVQTRFPHRGHPGNRVENADGPNTSDQMTYHGGRVMTSTTSYAIFWLPSPCGRG